MDEILGLAPAEIARQLGVSQPALRRILRPGGRLETVAAVLAQLGLADIRTD